MHKVGTLQGQMDLQATLATICDFVEFQWSGTGIPRNKFKAPPAHYQHRDISESCIGILPGWYGMENGQKPEMGKKKWKSKWKTAPTWTGAKMAKKWPKNGFLRAFSIIFPFLGHFLPFLPPSRLGPFSISISILFSHFRLLAVSMPYQHRDVSESCILQCSSSAQR